MFCLFCEDEIESAGLRTFIYDNIYKEIVRIACLDNIFYCYRVAVTFHLIAAYVFTINHELQFRIFHSYPPGRRFYDNVYVLQFVLLRHIIVSNINRYIRIIGFLKTEVNHGNILQLREVRYHNCRNCE